MPPDSSPGRDQRARQRSTIRQRAACDDALVAAAHRLARQPLAQRKAFRDWLGLLVAHGGAWGTAAAGAVDLAGVDPGDADLDAVGTPERPVSIVDALHLANEGRREVDHRDTITQMAANGFRALTTAPSATRWPRTPMAPTCL
jgi:hypothetical protein